MLHVSMCLVGGWQLVMESYHVSQSFQNSFPLCNARWLLFVNRTAMSVSRTGRETDGERRPVA